MPNYVYDNTALFFPKTDLDPIPGGADPTQYVQAVDWNTLNQAVDDIKGVLRGAVWYGLNDQTSDPLPSGIATYLWLTTTNVLNLKNGGTNYPIVLGPRTISAGTGLTGGGDLSADRTISLANTTVSPGSYTSADITVDAQGRITAAANGSGSVPTSRLINTSTGLEGGGDLTADRTLSLANTTVAPGSYTFTNLTVDAQGRLTTAATGGVGSVLASATVGSVLFVGAGSTLGEDNAVFFWDNTNNRLGIGNAAPGTTLDVTGTIRASAGITLSTMTAGSVLFAGASGAVAQDNTNLFWDDGNNRLGIGIGAPAATLDVRVSASGAGVARIQNTHAAGYSVFDCYDNGGAHRMGFGYDNGTSRNFISSATVDFYITGVDGGAATSLAHRFGTTFDGLFYQMLNGSGAAVSIANSGRIRYNTTGQKFQISANTAAYVDLVTQASGAGSANVLAKYTAAGVIADSSITDNGSSVFTALSFFAGLDTGSASKILNVGRDTTLTTDVKNGYSITTFSDGNNYIDSKTYTNGQTIYRFGSGAQSGAANTWLTLNHNGGATTAGFDWTFSANVNINGNAQLGNTTADVHTINGTTTINTPASGFLNIAGAASSYAIVSATSNGGVGNGFGAYVQLTNTDGIISMLRIADSGSGTSYQTESSMLTLSTGTGYGIKLNTNATDNSGLRISSGAPGGVTVYGTFDVGGNATIGNATTDSHVLNGKVQVNTASGGQIFIVKGETNGLTDGSIQVKSNKTGWGDITGQFFTTAAGSTTTDNFRMSVDSGFLAFRTNSVDRMTVSHVGTVRMASDALIVLDVEKTGTGLTNIASSVGQFVSTASFDTTAGAIPSVGVFANSGSTRSAGANDLINYGVYASATNGQVNYALYTDLGDVSLNNGGGMTTVNGDFKHSGTNLGFYGTTPIAKPTVSGSRANTEQALADLLTELVNLGLISDTTTA